MSVILSYPTSSPTVTLTLKSSFVSLTNVQATPIQTVHIAQGGRMFVFTPGTTPFVNRLLPLDIRWLHEADDGAFSGWEDVRVFILQTLEGSKQKARLTDPDGSTYVVRYVRGLESFQEVQLGRFSGTLMWREDP